MIEAWPIYQLTLASLRPGRVIAPPSGSSRRRWHHGRGLTAAVVALSLQLGIRRLEQLRD